MFQITQKKTRNKSSRQKSIPLLIVNHHANTDIESLHAFYADMKNRLASSHFSIAKNGDIFQYVDITQRAWHAGLMKDMYLESENEIVRRYKTVNPNGYSIAVTYEGKVDEELTEEQFWAGVWLYKYIRHFVIEKYGKYIEFDEKHIIGHCHVDPKRSSECGKNIPYERMFDELKGTERMDMDEFCLRLRYRMTNNPVDVANAILYRINDFRNQSQRTGRFITYGREMLQKSLEALKQAGIM